MARGHDAAGLALCRVGSFAKEWGLARALFPVQEYLLFNNLDSLDGGKSGGRLGFLKSFLGPDWLRTNVVPATTQVVRPRISS